MTSRNIFPGSVVSICTCLMDAVALLALITTGEVHVYTVQALGALLAISLLLHFFFPAWKKKLPRSFFLIVGVILLSSCLWLWLNDHYLLVVAVASTTPLLHGILWWMPKRSDLARGTQLRLVLGFIELLIASILTADFFLTLALFTYTLLTAVALSCSFLEHAFEERHAPPQALPVRYLLQSISVAFLVLLSAALLFPILPRAHVSRGEESTNQSLGYKPFSTLLSDASGRILLKITAQETPTELATLIPFGLLRMRVSSRYTAGNWETTNSPYQGTLRKPPGLTFHLRIEKDSFDRDELPVPYGAYLIKLEGQGASYPLRTQNGVWEAKPHVGMARYSLQVDQAYSSFGSSEEDEPKLEDQSVPSTFKTPKLQKFLKAHPSLKELKAFYARAHFSESRSTPTAQALFPTLPAVEEFLYQTQTGDSRLYATSLVLLLRSLDIPARYVEGFRISRGTQSSTLRIRSSDVHQWVEYWVPKKGWKGVDPTPQILTKVSSWEVFRDRLQDTYDSLQSFWYHRVYTFSTRSQMELGAAGYQRFQALRNASFHPEWFSNAQAWFLLPLVLFFGVFLSDRLKGYFDLLFQGSLTHLPLRWRRYRMQTLLNQTLHIKGDLFRFEQMLPAPLSKIFRSWLEIYFETRFGKLPAGKSLQLLCALEQSFRQELQGKKSGRGSSS